MPLSGRRTAAAVSRLVFSETGFHVTWIGFSDSVRAYAILESDDLVTITSRLYESDDAGANVVPGLDQELSPTRALRSEEETAGPTGVAVLAPTRVRFAEVGQLGIISTRRW